MQPQIEIVCLTYKKLSDLFFYYFIIIIIIINLFYEKSHVICGIWIFIAILAHIFWNCFT